MGDDIMYVSQALIDNINDSNSNAIEVYLRANNIQKSEEDEGMETKLWVNKLFGQSKINLDNFEEFLFSELFYGKRKLIRVYKIDECRKYSLPTDWGEGLALYSDSKGYEFSNILSSEPNEKKTAKIVATKMIKNEDGELNNLKLIFAYDIKLQGKDGELEKSCVYIPVEIDFINERMIIKAWQRKRVALETDRCESLFERTLNILNNNFHVKYVNIGTKHKKVLYQLSKNLIDNVYNQIPAFKAVADCSEIIEGFSNEIINRLPLENVVDRCLDYGVSINYRNKYIYKTCGLRIGTQEVSRYGWDNTQMLIIAKILRDIRDNNSFSQDISDRINILSANKQLCYTIEKEYFDIIYNALHYS